MQLQFVRTDPPPRLWCLTIGKHAPHENPRVRIPTSCGKLWSRSKILELSSSVLAVIGVFEADFSKRTVQHGKIIIVTAQEHDAYASIKALIVTVAEVVNTACDLARAVAAGCVRRMSVGFRRRRRRQCRCGILSELRSHVERGVGRGLAGSRDQIRSQIAAMPCPPPMHIVVRPKRPPVRASS